VREYLAALPGERRRALQAVRRVILASLDDAYEEGMQYGMIGYFVPHRIYPAGYHADPRQPLPFLSLASQKGHMALYLMCVYGDGREAAWFRREWEKTGRTLDMGKSCLRFRKIEDLALDVLGKLVARSPARKFIAIYESVLKTVGARKKR
jgi:hypothetical protein